MDSLKQAESIGAHLHRHRGAFALARGQPIGVRASSVPPHPFGIHPHGQPASQRARRCRSQCLQGCAQRLGEELQPVDRTHRREHVRGISALPTSGLEQSEFRQPGQQQVKRLLFRPVVDQPLPKSGQHRVIEPRIGQLQAERYFQSIRARTASAACRSVKF
jgi:hypothetical protein